MDQTEKIKISSDQILTKLFLIVVIGFIFLLFTDYKRTDTNTFLMYIGSFIILSLLLYYLLTRPHIYYDSENLYLIKGTILRIEIPLKDIQSINFSMIGFGQGGYSYKVKYLDKENEIKTVRIFPRVWSTQIAKFIKCAEAQNPNIKIRNWSFGFNELFE